MLSHYQRLVLQISRWVLVGALTQSEAEELFATSPAAEQIYSEYCDYERTGSAQFSSLAYFESTIAETTERLHDTHPELRDALKAFQTGQFYR